MAQEDNLGLQPRLRFERRSQYMQQQAKERNSSPQHYPICQSDCRVDSVFGSDTGPFSPISRAAVTWRAAVGNVVP